MGKERKKLQWQMPLYVGEEVSEPDVFVKNIDAEILNKNSFVITKSENPHNQLEFFSAIYLKQKVFRELCPPIVGIAGSKKDAVQVIMKITEECLHVTGNCNIKEYLKNR